MSNQALGGPFIYLLSTSSLSFPSFFKDSVASFTTAVFRRTVYEFNTEVGKGSETDTVLIHGIRVYTRYLYRMIYKKPKVKILWHSPFKPTLVEASSLLSSFNLTVFCRLRTSTYKVKCLVIFLPDIYYIKYSVVDPDPGSGSGVNNPDYISESFETIFWVKNT